MIATISLSAKTTKWQVGAFSPLKYQLNENTELSSYPLMNLVIPNMGVTYKWVNYNNFTFSSKNSISYPTPLLNIISKEGVGGILPGNSIIPNIITFNNKFIVDYQLSETILLKKYVGYSFAYISGKSDFTSLDYPLLYNHSTIFLGSSWLNFGTAFEMKLSDNWLASIDYDYYFLDKEYSDFYSESSLKAFWQINEKFSLVLGTKVVFADYPSSKQDNVNFFPILDFRYHF